MLLTPCYSLLHTNPCYSLHAIHSMLHTTHSKRSMRWRMKSPWPNSRYLLMACNPPTNEHCVNTTPATTCTLSLARYLLMACKPPIHTQTSRQHTSHNFHFGQVPSHGPQTAHSHKHHIYTTPAATCTLARYLLMTCSQPTHTQTSC